ncbi:MAG: hypothetical protein V8S72_01105 [Oscillospiraceae bacterium]
MCAWAGGRIWDDHAYVYGFIPASEGYEDKPCIGFIAHLYTIPDFPGENVQPQLIEHDTAATSSLARAGAALRSKFSGSAIPQGSDPHHHHGTTVRADDNAGIAASYRR